MALREKLSVLMENCFDKIKFYELLRQLMVSCGARYVLVLSLIISFLVLPQNILASPIITSQESGDQSLRIGPYIDGVTFSVIEDINQMILDLQSGSIDMHSGFLSEARVQSFTSSDSDILANSVSQNGYGLITINCRDYPLNISALRRAFALAFDKVSVNNDIFNGSISVHDSVLATPSEFCIEDDLPYHYYDNRSLEGNALLEFAGFDIDEGTGWRKAPNDEYFNITIEYDPVYQSMSGEIAEAAVAALQSLSIDAYAVSGDFNDILYRLDTHDLYDMVIEEYNFASDNVQFLEWSFHSDYAEASILNPSNFRNDSFDFYSDQLQHGATHEEIMAAASQMQLILHEQVPQLVCYEKVNNQAYRTDLFTDHINDLVAGVSGSWTLRQMYPIEDYSGGIVSIGLPEAPISFSMFQTSSLSAHMILDLLYPSLYDRNPKQQPIGDLTKNMTVQRNSDNPDVPAGHTRYTINILENATWSDGVPLTAHDVNFTLHYVMEVFRTNYGGSPKSLVGTDVPSPYQVVMEFDTESYWDFSYFAYCLIIPEHIFSNETISFETWDPIFTPTDPHVTCGPFLLDDFEVDEYYSLVYDPEFYYALNRTGAITPEPWSLLTYVTIGVSIASACVIISAIILTQHHRNTEHEEAPPSQESNPDETD